MRSGHGGWPGTASTGKMGSFKAKTPILTWVVLWSKMVSPKRLKVFTYLNKGTVNERP